MSPANSIEQLYRGHESSWSLYCSSNPDLVSLLEEKLPRLLSHEIPENVNQGVELLSSFDESALVAVLTLKGNSLQVTASYTSNAALIGRSVLSQVSQAGSSWRELYDLGCFDALLFLAMGEVSWNDLSEDIQQKLLSQLSELEVIPAGHFMMGALERDGDADDDEKPRHRVEISRSFLMGKYPVTQALYESVMGDNPSRFKAFSRPVETVSWFDAIRFCNALSEKEGIDCVYTIDGEDVSIDLSRNGYRLPTEAEWEYAARGGEEQLYAGSDNPDEVGWYRDNGGRETHPVGQKKANAFALYDMSGNVWEWCWDWYGEYTAPGSTDPVGPSKGYSRALRGGSWGSSASSMRSAFRGNSNPGSSAGGLGFRFFRSVP